MEISVHPKTSNQRIPLKSLNPECAVFQGLLCGGGATEEAERGEVPESVGGARPDEPG